MHVVSATTKRRISHEMMLLELLNEPAPYLFADHYLQAAGGASRGKQLVGLAVGSGGEANSPAPPYTRGRDQRQSLLAQSNSPMVSHEVCHLLPRLLSCPLKFSRPYCFLKFSRTYCFHLYLVDRCRMRPYFTLRLYTPQEEPALHRGSKFIVAEENERYPQAVSIATVVAVNDVATRHLCGARGARYHVTVSRFAVRQEAESAARGLPTRTMGDCHLVAVTIERSARGSENIDLALDTEQLPRLEVGDIVRVLGSASYTPSVLVHEQQYNIAEEFCGVFGRVIRQEENGVYYIGLSETGEARPNPSPSHKP